MATLDVLIVNAFTHEGVGGNPAGVVVDADSLSAVQKQEIARKIGLSETAFVSHSSKATHKIDFFTPTSQIALCGHATIATWAVLAKKRNYLPGKYSQELLNSVLDVDILSDGSVLMQQELPKFGKQIKIKELVALLGISDNLFLDSVQPQLVSTGNFDLMVAVKDVRTLESVQPDFDAISGFQQKNFDAGIHVFALTPESKAAARSRNFCPLLGIPEEAATGSSTGALLCYMFANNLLSSVEVVNGVWFEQGSNMGRPSDIFGSLVTDEKDQIEAVTIGGKATIVDSVKITL